MTRPAHNDPSALAGSAAAGFASALGANGPSMDHFEEVKS